MEIYNDDGVLDYAAASAEVAGARGITDITRRSGIYEQVTAAALLDIAVSLNTLVKLAHDSSPFDLSGDEYDSEGDGLGDESTEDEVRLFEVGGKVMRPDGLVGVVFGIGESEGARFVDADYGPSEGTARIWAEYLTPVKDEPTDAADANNETEPDPADAVDELDDDFTPATVAEPKVKKAGKSKSKKAGKD